MKKKTKKQQPITLDEIKLEKVRGSTHCEYSVIENKLEILYRNQEKILLAIKLSNEVWI